MPIFKNEYIIKPSPDEIEITLFGDGYGESIVIHIPDVGWGIIDSCQSKIKDSTCIPPLEYLNELYPDQPPPLSFLLLTHPHEDHYNGLDSIIRNYRGRICKICRYNGDGIRELKTYWAQQKIGRSNVLPGLPTVFKAINEAIRNGVPERRMSEMTILEQRTGVNIVGHGSIDIEIIALSPTSASVNKYLNVLFAACPTVGKVNQPVRDRWHNLLSVSLLIRVGNIRIILGSDVEDSPDKSGGWKGIVACNPKLDYSASLVKVAHHGSVNGYYDEMWKMHCLGIKPIAIMTPYCHGRTNIPDEEVLNNLKAVCSKIGITRRRTMSNKLNKYYSRNVVSSINRRTRSFAVYEEEDNVGFLRVRMKVDGRLTETMAVSPALWL